MKRRRDTIAQLQSDPRIQGECPSCEKSFALRKALLFYADEPFPQKAGHSTIIYVEVPLGSGVFSRVVLSSYL